MVVLDERDTYLRLHDTIFEVFDNPIRRTVFYGAHIFTLTVFC